MDKAVLVIAHKAPEQINMLIKQLLHDSNGCTDIFLHIDKKSESIKSSIYANEHVFFIKNNRAITWGNDSNVRMLLDCFQEILSFGKEYDYFQICTGQDLMIKKGLDDYLEKHKGKIFIEITKNDLYIKNLLLYNYPSFMRRDNSNNKFLTFIELLYIALIRIGIIPKKKLQFDYNKVDFWCSYNWSFMPFEVLKYIDKYLTDNKTFLDIYMNSRLPEDGFLGTIIMNSPYKDAVVFFEKEITVGLINKSKTRRGNSLTYLKPLENSHFPALTTDDIESLNDSSAFMARKFDINVDRKVIEYFFNKVIAQ